LKEGVTHKEEDIHINPGGQRGAQKALFLYDRTKEGKNSDEKSERKTSRKLRKERESLITSERDLQDGEGGYKATVKVEFRPTYSRSRIRKGGTKALLR